jgi:alpha-L-fucosidase 2
MTLNKFTALLAAVVVTAGCTDDDPTGLNYEFSVAATPTTITVAQDEYALIDATVTNLTLDQEVTGANVAWRTEDADVAVVVLYDHDGDGDEDEPTPEVPAVFGVGPGTTNIIATYRGAESTVAVTVTGDPITSGTLAATGGRTTIFEGDTVTLVATFRNADNEIIDRPVTFVSSDETVATVDEDGVVTAEYKTGTTTITAVSDADNNDVEATIVITVTKRPVAYIEVEPESAVITDGETVEIEAHVFGANDEELEGRTITWSSSNALVASVDAETGVVTGHAVLTPTTVTITATSEGVTKDVFITVVP